jgi:hypothetical protein
VIVAGNGNTNGTSHYPRDLRDDELVIVDPLIPRVRKVGRPDKYSKRTILGSVRQVLHIL